MSMTPRPPTFDGRDWSEFAELFEHFLHAAKIEEDSRKKSFLLVALGQSVYRIYRGLTTTPDEDKYADVCKLLRDYYAPEENEIYERYVFLTRHQQEGESVDAYLSDLRKLVTTCKYSKFGSACVDEMLRDKLVLGIRSETIRLALLRDCKLTLQSAIDTARTMERASLQHSQLKRYAPTASMTLPDASLSQPSLLAVADQKQTSRSCYRCGSTHHMANFPKCPARQSICRNCGKTGHYATVCRQRKVSCGIKSKAPTASTRGSNRYRCSPAVVQQVEELSIFAFSRPDCEQTEFLTKVLHVNGRRHTFILDTAAHVSVISYGTFKRLKLATTIKPSDRKLRAYGGKAIRLRGECLVSVKLDDRVLQNTPLCIVEEEGRSIMGLNWLRAFNLLPSAMISHISEEFDPIILQYGQLFQGHGCYRGEPVSLSLKPDAKPVFEKPYRLPYGLTAAC